MMQSMTTEKLLDLWEATNNMNYAPELPIVRGWLLDELEIRNPVGFYAWLDQEPAAKDEELRRFVTN